MYNYKFCLGKISSRLINNVTDKDQNYSMILINANKEYSLPVRVSESISIISKVALARPLLSMGPVKTLFICINENMEYIDYSCFDVYNNCKTFKSVACFGNVLKHVENNKYQYIEFLPQSGFYPLLWVQFLKDDFNHLEIQLAQARIAKMINVKFCENNDRRAECRLGYYYPNFDITYALFIGFEKVLGIC